MKRYISASKNMSQPLSIKEQTNIRNIFNQNDVQILDTFAGREEPTANEMGYYLYRVECFTGNNESELEGELDSLEAKADIGYSKSVESKNVVCYDFYHYE